MKVRTLTKFRDIKANVIRNKGEEFECSEERFEEICKKNSNLVESIPEEDPEGEAELEEESKGEAEPEEESEGKAEPEEDTDGSGNPCDIAQDLAALSKKELQDLAKKKGIKGVSGMNREELLEALQ